MDEAMLFSLPLGCIGRGKSNAHVIGREWTLSPEAKVKRLHRSPLFDLRLVFKLGSRSSHRGPAFNPGAPRTSPAFVPDALGPMSLARGPDLLLKLGQPLDDWLSIVLPARLKSSHETLLHLVRSGPPLQVVPLDLVADVEISQ